MAILHKEKNQSYYLFLNRAVVSLVLLLIMLSLIIPKGKDVLIINGLHAPFLDNFFSLLTNFGDGLVVIPIFLVVCFIRYFYLIALAGICTVNGALVSLLKRVIYTDAGRPISVLDPHLLYFVPGIDVHSAHSFPSGHTATAFAITVFIALIYQHRALTAVLLLIALLIGVSRIYLLQHFLIDVAAGALIGSFSTLAIYYSFIQMQWPAWAYFKPGVKLSRRGQRFLPSGR